MVYGFQGMVNYFHDQYPDYYIAPVRVSGSAIETLFSQLKFAAGGKLSAVNYPSALKRLLIKKDTTGHHKSGAFYRDQDVYFREIELKRRKRET